MMTVNMLAGRARAGRAVIATALAALLLPLLAVPGAMPARAGAVCTLVGFGDEEDPFEVADHLDLAEVGVDCGLDKHYRQTADITLPLPTPGGSNHTPIGNNSANFTGSYDGGGFAIIGMVIDNGTSETAFFQGFFGAVNGATLTGIRLVDATVIGAGTMGALVGRANGSTVIERASVSGESLVRGLRTDIGGLVGQANAGVVVSRSFSTASVQGREGSGDNTIGNGSQRVGGLVGIAERATIEESFATGSVTGFRRVGGLLGQIRDSAVVHRSFATGAVSGTVETGGLIGEADSGQIKDSYATGAVTGTEDSRKTSFPASTYQIGGFIGFLQLLASVENSYATGRVTAAVGAMEVGAFVGESVSTTNVDASFWDVDASGLTVSEGGPGVVGRSTVLMQTLATFTDAGWDISRSGSGTVWVACDGVYPALVWSELGAATVRTCNSAAAPVASPSFVAPGGVLPVLPVGVGAWVQADGSSVPLVVSSPGVNQVRYAADGIVVTFTGGSGSSVSRGLVADAKGEVVCEICVALAAGQVVEVWMFSTPRLVAAHLIADLPCQRFSVPVVSPLDGGGPVAAGAHTLQLALPTASGMQAVNVGVTVGGPVPASVPAGEGGVPFGAVLFVLLGAAGVLVAGRRMVTSG
jgi:hypothetical protein